MSNYLRFEMRLKLGSTLQSICNRRQREQAAAGAWTISHLSCGKPHFPSLACCKDYGHGDIVLSTSMRSLAYLLLLAFVACFPTTPTALPRTHWRDLLHLARFRIPAREIVARHRPGQTGVVPKVAAAGAWGRYQMVVVPWALSSQPTWWQNAPEL